MKKTRVAIFAGMKVLLIFLSLIQLTARAQNKRAEKVFTTIDVAAFDDNTRHWYMIADEGNVINARPNQPRYKATEISKIADNMLLYQKNNGGWPKNYDMMAILTEAQKDSLVSAKSTLNTTFDNGTTYTQVEALANV